MVDFFVIGGVVVLLLWLSLKEPKAKALVGLEAGYLSTALDAPEELERFYAGSRALSAMREERSMVGRVVKNSWHRIQLVRIRLWVLSFLIRPLMAAVLLAAAEGLRKRAAVVAARLPYFSESVFSFSFDALVVGLPGLCVLYLVAPISLPPFVVLLALAGLILATLPGIIGHWAVRKVG